MKDSSRVRWIETADHGQLVYPATVPAVRGRRGSPIKRHSARTWNPAEYSRRCFQGPLQYIPDQPVCTPLVCCTVSPGERWPSLRSLSLCRSQDMFVGAGISLWKFSVSLICQTSDQSRVSPTQPHIQSELGATGGSSSAELAPVAEFSHCPGRWLPQGSAQPATSATQDADQHIHFDDKQQTYIEAD